MKKIFNTIFIFIMTFVALFLTKGVCAANYKVVPSFDQEISNIKVVGDTAWYNNAHGLPFQSWNSEAAFCTKFRLKRPGGTSATCTLNTWDSEKIQVGVAAIIMDANADNSKMTKNYYYADLAINYFLFQYNLKSNGTKDYNNQVTSYNAKQAELNAVFGSYISYYNTAVSAIQKYSKTVAVKLKGASTNKSSFKINADNINSISNTYTLSGTNIDSAKVTVSLSGASSDVKVYINDKETKTVSGLKNGDSFTVKVEGYSEGENFKVNITATGQMDYYVAANYKCTSGSTEYQGLTLNRVVKKEKTDSVKASFNVTTYDAPDYPKLKIVKTDKDGNKVAGAGIRLYEKENDTYTAIETFNENDQSEYEYVEGELTPGEYCVAEYKAPSGYLLDNTKHCFKVKQNATTNAISIEKSDSTDSAININNNLITVTLIDEENLLRIWKVNEQGNFLEGATLKLTTERDINAEAYVLNGEKLEWQSTNDYKDITGLPAGTYYLYEVKAPSGFIKTEDYRVITISKTTTGPIRVAFSNRPNSISISKVDIANGEELPGATLRILKDDEKTVATDIFGNELEWVSGNEPHTISKIPAGTYYLEETQAPKEPKGYSLMTEKIKFSIDEYGKVTINDETSDDSVIIMSNAVTKVSISKQDITTKEELPGAHLILKNENDEVVEDGDWVSGNEPHTIEGLIPGKYTLTEITAPDGYSLNEESITFTINEDGSITGDTVMYNTPIPEVPSTSSSYSIFIIIGGVILVGAGIGLYIYGIKKQKEI